MSSHNKVSFNLNRMVFSKLISQLIHRDYKIVQNHPLTKLILKFGPKILIKRAP